MKCISPHFLCSVTIIKDKDIGAGYTTYSTVIQNPSQELTCRELSREDGSSRLVENSAGQIGGTLRMFVIYRTWLRDILFLSNKTC
uniref:Uncharacterized protein n=1 Tax=Arion vulgaris TaxID=1028688 RepID=A0A0B6Z0J0_9EUPU